MTDPVKNKVTRRQALLLGGSAAGATLLATELFAQRVVKEIHQLRPGEFTWHPDRSPSGSVAIVVSIPDQRVHVYRNGIRIAVSTCSTGRQGHGTPTGVFTILQKDRNHHSSTYNNAPMPNMNRLTWSGIALHAGKLPGYPASHGCVRLPMEFSRLLFTVTHVGTPVIIANDHSDPVQVAHPGMVLAGAAERKLEQAVQLAKKKHPALHHAENQTPPLSVLVSSADRRIVVLENGHVVAQGSATIRDPQTPLGSHVFVLSRAADGHTYWHGIGHHHTGDASASDLATLQRIGGDKSVIAAITERMHPGATLTTVDLPITTDSR
ncbi:MAG: L,D-transpeptidase, partial [Beijerinckiaceae bacterium]